MKAHHTTISSTASATSAAAPRRRALAAWGALALGAALSMGGWVAWHAPARAASEAAKAEADAWPRQPVTLVLGFSAGSGVDVVARLIQQPLSQRLGQPVVIDHKGGAAGNIASAHVARARPDGYTLALGTAATHGSNAALYPNLGFDVEADFVPVATLNDVSNVLTINPAVLDVKTLAEFVAAVRANPGKYNFASTGNGTGTHMAFAELNTRLGLDMVHVPYKGGPEALNGVLRGEACCIMNQVQTVLPHYQAGTLRLLGVTTARRVPAVAEVPTIGESGVPGTQGFDSAIWFGIFAPKGTPAPVVQRLNTAIAQTLAEPSVRQSIERLGNSVRVETPEQFAATVKANRQKSAELVRAAKVVIN